MTKSRKQKLIASNAAIWAAGSLASFALPLIAESMLDGRRTFPVAMAHMFPLIVAMAFSTIVISNAVGEPVDEEV